MQAYSNLKEMISKNGDARQYYNKLPGYIREQIFSCGSEVTSFDALKRRAETLLEGL